jgi:TRAP-type C4-dicarboxylate transport system permease small subunit
MSDVAPAFLDRLAAWTLRVAGIALIGMVLVESWQVFARYVLNDSPGWTEPVALLLLNVAMSLGAAAAVRSRAHFAFPIAVQACPPPLRRVLEILGDLVVAGIGLVLAIWGAQLLVDGWSVRMAGAALPQSAVFLPMAIAGVLMALFSLAALRRTEPR